MLPDRWHGGTHTALCSRRPFMCLPAPVLVAAWRLYSVGWLDWLLPTTSSTRLFVSLDVSSCVGIILHCTVPGRCYSFRPTWLLWSAGSCDSFRTTHEEKDSIRAAIYAELLIISWVYVYMLLMSCRIRFILWKALMCYSWSKVVDSDVWIMNEIQSPKAQVVWQGDLPSRLDDLSQGNQERFRLPF